MRISAALALLLFSPQDEELDPSRYLGPAGAKTTELKLPAPSPRRARAWLGVGHPIGSEEGGVVAGDVPAEGPAAKAGLQAGDRLVRLDGEEFSDFDALARLVRARKPGDKVELLFDREGEEKTAVVTLGTAPADADSFSIWTRPEFRLGVVLVEFQDVRHNPAFALKDWEEMLFSAGTYTGRNPSGDRVYGSVADFWRENSYGKLTLKGHVFDWTALDHDRDWYEDRRMGDREGWKEFLPKAVSKAQERDGAETLDGMDGLVFVYAGRQTYERPWMLWPHRASIKVGKRTLPYYLVAEGGKYFNAINVHCHEFGHMLGLPDQYGQRHATGIGKWCTMAVGHMGAGESRAFRPHHLCLWCKERLGYVTPAVISPREAQGLKLGPIEKDAAQAFKLQIGSDVWYLENRQRTGFDAEIEGAGLLIWKAGRDGSIDLIESHGKKVPDASLVEAEDIPYPSFYNRHFTPSTKPAAPAGLYLTDIAEKEGILYFKIGIRKEVTSNSVQKRSLY